MRAREAFTVCKNYHSVLRTPNARPLTAIMFFPFVLMILNCYCFKNNLLLSGIHIFPWWYSSH